MSRWQPDARGRLEVAALELFTQQGFAETTVPQITARAGLTTRTFFRHFADKREVLFGYIDELPAVVAEVMAQAPPQWDPMTVVRHGLETVAATQFEGQLSHLRARHAVVQADNGLRERELRKESVLSEAIHRGFRDRGVDDLIATLAAHTAVTVLSVSVDRWLGQDGDRPLPEFLHDTLRALAALAAGAPDDPED